MTTMAISQKLTTSFNNKMPKTPSHSFNTFFLVLLLFLTKMCYGISVLDLHSVKTSELEGMVKRFCAGKISECSEMAVEEEQMDSENNKRMLLMQKRFISYDTLKRDMVPCATPGASYYNCRGAPANAYNRGCEMITRCDRGG